MTPTKTKPRSEASKVTPDTRTSRATSRTALKTVSISTTKSRATSNQATSKQATSKAHVLSSKSTLTTDINNDESTFSSMESQLYYGPQVQIITNENNSLMYFLKLKFGKYLKHIEGELNGDVIELPKIKKIGDKNYHLIVSKQKEKSLQTSLFERSSKNWYVAYYIGGKHFSTADDVKKMLEKLGDFSKIALQPGKICSRLELLVSPSCSHCPIFTNSSKDFELIEENQHVGKINNDTNCKCSLLSQSQKHFFVPKGCGFAPPSFFDKVMNVSRYPSKKNTTALQIRIFCSSLGWFKGMLMKKENIGKVQLPTSMLKVGKSLHSIGDDDAYIVIKQCFPSKTSSAFESELEGKRSSKSLIQSIKPLGDQYKNLLISNGLHQDDIEMYEDYFKERGKPFRTRHDSIVSF